ncbi:integrase catalytic domain-containing protein [Nephila pilipes]|uniref:Integrase catalytic domain-containing protein n=1 Tax=Nephila pilipes TaxID=299642 RepID=A0A8X6MPN1_NEPPI|nr:integrase catalytic domain-containing protein [Nephila pilipes]
MIDKHLYMDDFLASTDTETHITMLYHEIKDLMTLMKPPMEKWATNSLKLKDLLADLMGTRLLKYFCEEVDLQPCAATLWTDSKITLSLIRSDPNKRKTFVCNRTTEILQYTSPDQWRHCPETDHLSREDLSSYKQLKTDNEARKPLTQSLYVETTNLLIDITYYNSYTKRVTAGILRFLHNCRNEQRFLFELTAEELQKAKDYWILNVQQQCFHTEMETLRNNHPLPTISKIARFNPFLKNKQIRLGCRLQFAPLSADVQHPLLLEGNHPFVLLLIKNTHVCLHHLGTRIVLSQLRSDFWILRGRQAIKEVLHKCLPCKLSKLKCGNQIKGPLPSERVTPRNPFSTTCIDFAGPLFQCCYRFTYSITNILEKIVTYYNEPIASGMPFMLCLCLRGRTETCKKVPLLVNKGLSSVYHIVMAVE